MLGIGAVLAVAFRFGSGSFQVVAPQGASVTVNVDGQDVGTVTEGEHQRFSIDQGSHGVKLTASNGKVSTHQLAVNNGAFDQVLPVGDQCFVVLDVTNYVYEKQQLLDKIEGVIGEGIVVKSKVASPGPFDTPAGAFYSMEELPDSIEQGKRTELLLEISCEAAHGSDADAVVAAQI